MANEAQGLWIKRVLGVDVGAGAPERKPLGRVDYMKLLLRWRAAQARLRRDLDDIASGVIGHNAARRDPRYEQAVKLAARVRRLIPVFGGALEDCLDRQISGQVTDPDGFAREASDAIAAYRGQLARTERLTRLEAFSAKHLGGRIALVSELDHVLVELDQQIIAANRAGG